MIDKEIGSPDRELAVPMLDPDAHIAEMLGALLKAGHLIETGKAKRDEVVPYWAHCHGAGLNLTCWGRTPGEAIGELYRQIALESPGASA